MHYFIGNSRFQTKLSETTSHCYKLYARVNMIAVLRTEIDHVIVVRADLNTDGEVNVLNVQEIVNSMLVI
jgi:alkyl hydroperoxide reductase subunit AhpF